ETARQYQECSAIERGDPAQAGCTHLMRIEFEIQLLEGRYESRRLFESGKGTNAILLKKWFLRRRLRFVAVTIETLLRLLSSPIKIRGSRSDIGYADSFNFLRRRS